MMPPPARGVVYRQACSGSGRHRSNREVNRRISPSSPLSTNVRTARKSASHRRQFEGGLRVDQRGVEDTAGVAVADEGRAQRGRAPDE